MTTIEQLIDPKYEEIRNLMLPSLGYVGGTWSDCLDIPVDGEISAIRVTNMREVSDFVNFRYLVPVRSGRPTLVDPARVSSTQSSERAGSLLPPYLLQSTGTGVHTGRGLHSWWQADLESPLTPDALRLLNRRDKWGIRSHRIRIEVKDMTGSWRSVYDSTSGDYLCRVLSCLKSIAGSKFPNWLPNSPTQAAQWHDDALHAVRATLDAIHDRMGAADWLYVAALIPTIASQELPKNTLSGNEWRILAHGLYNQVKRDRRARSGIASFGGVLNTRRSIKRIGSEIEQISRQSTAGIPHTVSRHGVAPLGLLNSQSKQFLSGITELLTDLESLQSQGMLAYGTLLGAVREGSFIQHDDDVDLFYTVNTGPSTPNINRTRILDGLRDKGWRVTPIPKYMNVHVTKSGSPISLDLFPLDLSETTVQLHMESMKTRELPSRWFAQTTMKTIDGRKFPVPIAYEEFLTERYGKTWRVPDPFHNWSWRLLDD